MGRSDCGHRSRGKAFAFEIAMRKRGLILCRRLDDGQRFRVARAASVWRNGSRNPRSCAGRCETIDRTRSPLVRRDANGVPCGKRFSTRSMFPASNPKCGQLGQKKRIEGLQRLRRPNLFGFAVVVQGHVQQRLLDEILQQFGQAASDQTRVSRQHAAIDFDDGFGVCGSVPLDTVSSWQGIWIKQLCKARSAVSQSMSVEITPCSK